MHLNPEAVIAEAKILNYLLKWQPEGDKSRFLASAGYGMLEASRLAQDIRTQLLPLEAVFEEATEYGDKYRIQGVLTGPNGRSLRVVTAWMIEHESGRTKFLTLFPDRRSG